MCISGLTGLQRSLYKAASVDKADKEDWMETGSLNNLAAVYQFYCGGKELDKEKRNVFVHGTLDDVKEQFQVSFSSFFLSSINFFIYISIHLFSHKQYKVNMNQTNQL